MHHLQLHKPQTLLLTDNDRMGGGGGGFGGDYGGGRGGGPMRASDNYNSRSSGPYGGVWFDNGALISL